MERLQESYVDIGDRCNDLQDEVAELREKVAALQTALATRSAFASSSAASSFTPPSASPSIAVGNAVQSKAVPVSDTERAAKVGGGSVDGKREVPKQILHKHSFSAAAYADDFEEYEDEFEVDQ